MFLTTILNMYWLYLQLIFNLTDAEQWPADAVYNGFDFQTFYNVIVDYFDNATDAISRRNNKELLMWWNKWVFHHDIWRAGANYITGKFSRNMPPLRPFVIPFGRALLQSGLLVLGFAPLLDPIVFQTSNTINPHSFHSVLAI